MGSIHDLFKAIKESKFKGYKGRVIENSFWNIISTISSSIGGMIFTILIARMFFPELFGVYSIVLALVMAISSFSNLGISQAVIRYVAEALGNQNKDKARTYFKTLFKIKFLIALGLSLALFFLSKTLAIYIFGKPILTTPFQVGAIYLFINALWPLFTSIFAALQKLKYEAISQIIFQVSRIILIYIFLATVKTVPSVFVGLILAVVATIAYLFFILNKNFPYLIKGKSVEINTRRLIKFSGLFSVISISSIFFAYLDKLMLGILMPAEYAGYYNASLTIVFGVAGLVSFSVVFLPVFTQLKKYFKRAFETTFKYSAIFSFPLAFGLIFFAKPFITLVFGQEYLLGVLPTYVLALLIIESTTFSFFITAFISKEKLKYPAIMMILTTFLNVVLNYFLITSFMKINIDYGVVGAALATLISRYFFSIALTLKARKTFNIRLKSSWILKPLLSAGFMLLSLLLLDLVFNLSLPFSLVYILIGAIIYFSVMIIIKGITKQDLFFFKSSF